MLTMMKRLAVVSLRGWPLGIALALALAFAIAVAAPTVQRNHYLQYHFHYLSVRLLVSVFNHSALYLLGVFLLPAAVYWGVGRFNPSSPRWARGLAALLPVIGVGAFITNQAGPRISGFLVQILPWCRSSLQSVGRFLLTPTGIACVVAIVAITAILLLKSREATVNGRRLSFVSPLLRAFHAIRTALALAVLLVPLALVLAMYGALGILHLRNVRALHAQPNIIFIMVDTLRADRLGSYGCDLPLTPNIDRLAEEGIRFEHAVAQASWTLPSVTSLFTSRYPDWPYQQGQQADLGMLLYSEYLPTLPEVLSDAGYTTNAIVSNPFLAGTRLTKQGYAYYDDHLLFTTGNHGLPPRGGAATAQSLGKTDEQSSITAEQITDLALARLPALRDQKFFLYLLYFDPHIPYTEHEGFAFGESKRDRLTPLLPEGAVPHQLSRRQHDLRGYNSEVGYTDYHIGRLLKELRRQGLYDDTLIVFFSDHGEEFLEHGAFRHQRTIYEEVIQVPLIIKLPRQRAGKVVGGTFPLIDLYPSLLSHLDIARPNLGLQGQAVPIATLLRVADKPTYSATVTAELEYRHAVRFGGYKYIITEGERPQQELYDLLQDPGEQKNIYGAHPAGTRLTEVLATRDGALLPIDRAYLRRIVEREEVLGMGYISFLVPPVILDQLHSLGYTNPGGNAPDWQRRSGHIE
ncbi:MAG: sulfatase family protein [Armatimonadota bacterium]